VNIPAIISLEEFREERRKAMTPPRETRFGRVSYGEVRTRERRPPDYIIADWMVRREQSFLAGESQSGKSFLATHAGLCVAAGMPFMGRAVKQGLVIYLAAESGTGVLDQRIPAWMEHYGKDLQDIPFEILTTRVDLFHDASSGGHIDVLLEAVGNISREWNMPPLLIIVDTFNKVMPGGNENDGRDVSKVLINMDRLSRETGAHVCTVHHLPKAGGTMRGHGSLKADVDTVGLLSVEPATKIRTMVFDKVKDGANGGKLQFELLYVPLGHREDGQEFGSCVVLPIGKKAEAQAQEAVGFKLSDSEYVFMQSLFEAMKKKPEPLPEGYALPGAANGLTLYDSMTAIYAKKVPFWNEGGFSEDEVKAAKEKHRNKRRSDFERIQKWLIKAGVIRVQEPYIWHTGKALRAFPHTLPKTQNTVTPEVLKELDGVANF
jgi:hypothetical protein